MIQKKFKITDQRAVISSGVLRPVRVVLCQKAKHNGKKTY